MIWSATLADFLPLEEVRDSSVNQQAFQRAGRKTWLAATFIWRHFFFLVSTCFVEFIVAHNTFLTWIFPWSLACSKVSVVSPVLHPARFHICILQGAPASTGLCRLAGEICQHFCSAATFHPSGLAASSCTLSLARVWTLHAVWHSADIKTELNLLCKTAVPFRCFLPPLSIFLEQGQSVHACVGGRESWNFLVSLEDPTK